MKSLAPRFALLASLAACATDKPDLDASTIDAIDINEGKEDSLRFPTLKGTLGMGDSTTGRVSKQRSYHAYDFTYEGQPGLVRLDLKSTAGRDLVLAAYRRTGNTWVLETWNDDCGDGSLNSCIALPSTAGQYRFVATTYEALSGSPTIAWVSSVHTPVALTTCLARISNFSPVSRSCACTPTTRLPLRAQAQRDGARFRAPLRRLYPSGSPVLAQGQGHRRVCRASRHPLDPGAAAAHGAG